MSTKHIYVNRKMISVETIPGMGGWRKIVEGWFQVQYIWCIVKAFVNATMYPHPTQL
jgi:hypothetical protein